MRAVVQRVSAADVRVDSATVGSIGRGLVVLLGVNVDDTEDDLRYIVDKVAGMRIFDDAAGTMNLALEDVGGAILLVSQFTLAGDMRGGRRPSFITAARPELARPLYERAIAALQAKGIRVETGRFGADMRVTIVGDGPVTILLDSKKLL